jgi:hypothetical protein
MIWVLMKYRQLASASLSALMPATLASLFMSSPQAASTILWSELAAPTQPHWFNLLPTPVQLYFKSEAISIYSTMTQSPSSQTIGGIENPSSSTGAPNLPSPDASGGLSSGAKAGIAVGTILGAVVLVGLVILLCFRKRKHRAASLYDDKILHDESRFDDKILQEESLFGVSKAELEATSNASSSPYISKLVLGMSWRV